MKNLTLKTLLVALLIMPFVNVSAQHIDRSEITHWSLGLKGGTSWWDFSNDYYAEWDFGWHAGLVLEYSINPIFGIGLDAGYYNHDELGATTTRNNELVIPFRNQSIDGMLYGSINLSNLFSPARQRGFWKAMNIYTTVGGGVGVYNYNTGAGESDFKIAPLVATGLNIEFNLGRMWALGIGGDYRWHLKDDLSGTHLGRNIQSVNAQLLLRYKFGAGRKKHVRNLTTAEFYPQPTPTVVVDNTPSPEVMNRLRTLENTNNANRQKMQELEQQNQRINQALERAGNKISDLSNQPDPVANLVVENIEFVLNQKNLSNTNKAILDQVAAILLANMNSWRSLEIKGYTDATGTDAINLRLSETRARLVANYLISKGISSSRISEVRGYGNIKPVASNATAEGRNRNRRVEVNIVK